MISGTAVDRSEDIVKHAKALFVEGDRVDGAALLPRPNDQDGSSVHRLRVFSGDDATAMGEVRARSRLTLRPSHRFFQLNVGDLADCLWDGAEIGPIAVVPDPLPAQSSFPEDPSHALVIGLPPKGLLDDLVGDLIRRKIKRVHQAVET